MAIAAKDGAWVHTSLITEIYCSKCKRVGLHAGRLSEQEEDRLVKDHINDKHGGVWT